MTTMEPAPFADLFGDSDDIFGQVRSPCHATAANSYELDRKTGMGTSQAPPVCRAALRLPRAHIDRTQLVPCLLQVVSGLQYAHHTLP